MGAPGQPNARHASDYVKDCTTLLEYVGIVIVSGDGLVHEVFNGLALHTLNAAAVSGQLSSF